MRVTRILAGILTLAAGAAAPTTSPVTQPSIAPEVLARVESLLVELGSDNWQGRQKAQDALIHLGEPARAPAEKLLAGTRDVEVRTRVAAVLRALDDTRISGTSMITMHLKNATPQQVFADLSRQAYAELRPSPPDLWTGRQWPTCDIDIDGQPFWKALMTVCDKFGVGPQNIGSEQMAIMDRNAGGRLVGDAPQVVNGPFLVAATHINRTNSVDLNQANNIRRNCYVQFVVLPEPKLRVLHGSSQPRLTEAVDEKGNSLLGGVNMNEGMQPAYSWIWNMQCYLTPPEEAGKKIARLKGTMRFTIQTRAESASIEDLAQKNVEKVVGGRRFIFKEMAQKDQFYIVKMTLYRGGWAMADWNSVYNCNIFRLSDGAGQFLQRTSTNPRGGGGDTMEIEVQFQKQNWNGVVTGAPVKLTWDVPVESKEITVPFDFADLPLP